MNNFSKNLVVFDIDDTIVDGQTQRLFLDYLHKSKAMSHLHYVKVLLWFVLYKLGLVKHPKKIMETAFLFLEGTSEVELSKITNLFFDEVIKDKIYSEARRKIKKHRDDGDDLMLLSNAAHPVVEKIAKELNIELFISTRLELVDSIFTGKIEGEPVYGKNKMHLLRDFLSDKAYKTVYAYADHLSDYDLLSFVDVACVVNPNSELSRIANSKGWKILKFQ